MPESPSMTSSEIGVLWVTYQQKTMILRMMEYFIEKADDEEAKKIMTDLSQEVSPYVSKITTLFQNEGIAVPVGFTSEDVNKDVPKLYDNETNKYGHANVESNNVLPKCYYSNLYRANKHYAKVL